MVKPPKRPKIEEIETEPDAWPRFERFIRDVAKVGPQPRKAKPSKRRKPQKTKLK